MHHPHAHFTILIINTRSGIESKLETFDPLDNSKNPTGMANLQTTEAAGQGVATKHNVIKQHGPVADRF